MKETLFYDMCDKIETITLPQDMQGYYPTVEEIDKNLALASLEQLSPILIFLANDPYKNDEIIGNRVDYKDSVRYAKKLVSNIKIENDEDN